ncbi:related to CTD kinase subunit gamma [Lecanosticta acicola]|uniref:Related to CTD kinase subunit gamma n=1 Tax=Lecanosticta acicola TaxID=111012 RepID=A0AAI8YZ91_9PEZI|nr:related to CTD kinase subunit gamma [Lecanosticta acicola]
MSTADPFEVRMRFTSQLQHLNASTSSATKAANYALRFGEFSDDLHSCILEQLERNNMNNRANIMYFLPALCDTAKNQNDLTYVRMMERDILRIVDLVAPDDGSGAANVKVVRKVLGVLEGKGFLMGQTVKELEECIAGRDSVPGAPSSPVKSLGAAGVEDATTHAVRSTPLSVSNARDHAGAGGYYNPGIRLDKRQIEQRIEEDRERHKRAREGIWAIPQSEGAANLAVDEEFGRIWEDGSDVDEDDYRMAREEAEERRRHLEYDDY